MATAMAISNFPPYGIDFLKEKPRILPMNTYS
jgi:hypothetical protein